MRVLHVGKLYQSGLTSLHLHGQLGVGGGFSNVLRVPLAQKPAMNPEINYRNQKARAGLVEVVAPEFCDCRKPQVLKEVRVFKKVGGNSRRHFLYLKEV